MAKGAIAHHEQFPLWPQYFQKSSAAIASNSVWRWESVNSSELASSIYFIVLCIKVILFKLFFKNKIMIASVQIKINCVLKTKHFIYFQDDHFEIRPINLRFPSCKSSQSLQIILKAKLKHFGNYNEKNNEMGYTSKQF